MTPWLRDFFIWARDKVYTLTNRVYFDETEVVYLIDIVDNWIAAYPSIAEAADDDEIEALHDDMSTAMGIRNKLWEQLHG